jgi:hypothetical protein
MSQPFGPPLHVPPHANSEEVWRQNKSKPKPAPKDNNVEMADATAKPPPAKPTPGYHFISTIQDMPDMDAVQAKILDTMITLPLRDVIGCLADLQK